MKMEAGLVSSRGEVLASRRLPTPQLSDDQALWRGRPPVQALLSTTVPSGNGPADQFTTVILVRHGESGANKRGAYAGHTATRLTARGRQQAQQTAEVIGARRVAAVLCGPLPRTRQTARAIAAACGVFAQPAAALDEIGLGAWQGLTQAEIAARYPAEWRLWRERPEQLAFPGFEPLHEAAERVTRFLSELHRSCPDGDVVVVTHEALIRLAVLHVLGAGISSYRRLTVAPCSISELRYSGATHGTLLAINGTQHLI